MMSMRRSRRFTRPAMKWRLFGVIDGEAAVRDLLNGMITGSPDWHIETGPFRHGTISFLGKCG